MKNWQKVLSAASVCLVMFGSVPASAVLPTVTSLTLDQAVVTKQPLQLITGTVTHEELEGGFYAVAGYRLVGDEQQFSEYLGLAVQVSGRFSDQPSVYLTKAIEVLEITLQERQTLGGELTWVQLESGFYAVSGYRLIGNAEQFAALLGQQVTVTGKLSDQVSIYMTKAIEVEELKLWPAGGEADHGLAMVSADRCLPESVTVDGQAVHFSQGPLVQEGTLYLPLRAIVLAAGGRVHWSGKTRTASVVLPDRTATFVLGEEQAEMNEDGVRYLLPNLIQLAKAPMLYRGHTYLSADALSTVLGLCELPTENDGVLQLVSLASLKK